MKLLTLKYVQGQHNITLQAKTFVKSRFSIYPQIIIYFIARLLAYIGNSTNNFVTVQFY